MTPRRRKGTTTDASAVMTAHRLLSPAAFSMVLFCDNFRLERASDVTSGAAKDDVGLDFCVKLANSRLNLHCVEKQIIGITLPKLNIFQ